MPIQGMNIQRATSIGGKNTSAPIYWRRRIHILNRRGVSNLQDEYSNIGGLHGIANLKVDGNEKRGG
jgi:hypothetical protein